MNPNEFITDVETQLKYGIVETKDIYNLLYRETDNELYNHSTFSVGAMPYEYRNWLTTNGYDADEYTLDNNLTGMQYDKSIIVDLHSDGDWMTIFNEDENNFVHLMKRITELFHHLVLENYDSSVQNTARNHHQYLLWQDWCDEVEFEEHHQLSPSQVRTNGYRHDSAHPVVNILDRTFRVRVHEYPTGVELDIDSMNYIKHRIFMATKAAKFWSTMPMRYLMIPLPSDTYIEYLEEEANTQQFQEKNYLWGNDSLRFYQATSHSNYYYNDLFGHMWWYDSAADKWLPREGRWGRQHRECNVCRQVHSSHYLTWYREVNTYGNGNRSRICFDCAAVHAISYNTSDRCFVVVPSVATQGNLEAYSGMEHDYYVNMIHGDSVPTARGSRDYLFKVIDDPEYQDEVMFNDGQAWSECEALPVDVRKYMTWMYKSFKHVQGDIKNEVIPTIKEHYLIEGDSDPAEDNRDNVAVSPNDEYPYGLSGADYMRKIGAHLPNVYVYASDNPIADVIVSLRIDTQYDSRVWYYTSRSSQASTRRADDNWRPPEGIGFELNVIKNEYRFAPEFYYVDYRDGEYFNYSVDVQHSNVPMGHRCGCTHCVGQDQTHPTRPDWHYETGLHMGLELELVARDRRLLQDVGYLELFERTIQVFHPENLADMVHTSGNNRQLLYAKRDGSLPSDSGVEYISQPMTLRAWHAVPDKFWKMVESNYKAFGLEDVGIHIHFPWASMNLAHAYTMLSALNALQLNPNGLLCKIAQRNDSTYARWDLLTYRDTYNVVAEVAKNRTRADNDKYKAINLQHENTVELRYFKSNARGSRVLKNLEFLDALYTMTRRDAESTTGWNHDNDMPQSDLIEVATQYGNQSTKFKIDGVHHEQVPYANDIEFRLYNYVLDRQNNYPNLYEFLFDDGEEETSADIELTDIGYWNVPVQEEQVETPEVDIVFRNTSFNFGSESITLDGTTYTNNER